MSVLMLLGVALGGAVGAVARYSLAIALNRGRIAWGTVAANAAGSAILGAVIAAAQAESLGAWAEVALGAGVAGGLSTFSTLAVDVIRAWRADDRRGVAWYVAATIATGAVAAFAGFELTGLALA